jgi:hypothetical protein
MDDGSHTTHGYKARNYHLMLEYLLSGLQAIHADPTILDNFPLRIGGYVKYVNLRIPVAFFMSDTQGADKLCGRYQLYNMSVSRIHRMCNCAPLQASNTVLRCAWVTQEDMLEVIESGDRDLMTSLSQHNIASPTCI